MNLPNIPGLTYELVKNANKVNYLRNLSSPRVPSNLPELKSPSYDNYKMNIRSGG